MGVPLKGGAVESSSIPGLVLDGRGRSGPFAVHELELWALTAGGRTFRNTVHVAEPADPAPARDFQYLLEVLALWFQGAIYGFPGPASLGSSKTSWERWLVRAASSVFAAPGLNFVYNRVIEGLAEDEPLGDEVTLSLEWLTPLTGRRGHGATRLIGLPRGALDPNNPDAFDHTWMQGACSVWSTLSRLFRDPSIFEYPLVHCVKHSRATPTSASPSPWWHPVTGVRVKQNAVGTMRKRRGYPYQGGTQTFPT